MDSTAHPVGQFETSKFRGAETPTTENGQKRKFAAVAAAITLSLITYISTIPAAISLRSHGRHPLSFKTATSSRISLLPLATASFGTAKYRYRMWTSTATSFRTYRAQAYGSV